MYLHETPCRYNGGVEPDLNLLPALDALLTEGSVAAAARRMKLSASAMSRTLARLRDTTGDPLLVRAGGGLVPTPRALELRERVREVAAEARAMLRPARSIDLGTVEQTFTIRANDGFVEAFAARLVSVVVATARGVRLRFATKADKDVRALRDGQIDLEIGVLGASGPEVRIQRLFRDRFVGVVRAGHPLLRTKLTAERFATCDHVVVSRRGIAAGPVDDALAARGIGRVVVAVVPSFRAALAIVRSSDLVALVSESFMTHAANDDAVEVFALPVATPPLTVSQMWHPKVDTDPVHRWLRGVVRDVCQR